MIRSKILSILICVFICILMLMLADGCGKSTDSEGGVVPHEGKWGIYALDLNSHETTLLYSTDNKLSGIDLSNSGNLLVFAIQTREQDTFDTTSEIYTYDIATDSMSRLTDNVYFDIYPSFSPNDSNIVYLSKQGSTLDLYVMNLDGSDQHLLYDSGGNDADVDWGNNGMIVFTRDYQIWKIDSDGSNPQQLTDPQNAGQWGNANLPIGDYDPRISPDGSLVAYERMVDTDYIHGGYDIFVISANGTGEDNLTNNGSLGYAQGFANWSHSGDKLAYIVTAVGNEGRYDLYMIDADGTDNHKMTPDYYPADFLCHIAIFSKDDSQLYFVGQWWE